MRKLYLGILIVNLLSIGGCAQKHVPQEGEIVTWKQSPQLVVKAKLGPRRDLVFNTPRSPSHMPDQEHYLGQFPIDYVPEKFPNISEEEVKQLSKPYGHYQLAFDLVLNGASFKSTDKPLVWKTSLDHLDQIKIEIEISNHSSNKTTDQFWRDVKKDKYLADLSKKYSAECYLIEHVPYEIKVPTCFGQSKVDGVPSVLISLVGENNITAESVVPRMGIRLQWRIDKKHLIHWKEVNTNIWRLLNIWNVAPASDSVADTSNQSN